MGIATLYNIIHPISSILHKIDQILLIEGSLATHPSYIKKGAVYPTISLNQLAVNAF